MKDDKYWVFTFQELLGIGILPLTTQLATNIHEVGNCPNVRKTFFSYTSISSWSGEMLSW